MVQQCDVTEVEIDGRSFWVRPVSPDILQAGNVVAAALADSLDKPYSSVYLRESHVQGNRFDLGNPGIIW